MGRALAVLIAAVSLACPGFGDTMLVPIVTGLDQPVAIASTPSDPRLFIAEQPGRILAIDESSTSSTFLDIRDRVRCCGERGLLGLAFDPAESPPSHVWVDYIEDAGNTRVSRFTIDLASGLADPSSERVVLTIAQPFSNHNGGQLNFGPDGNLWIASGDGGSGGDPLGNAQNPGTLLGKILRIAPSPDGGYTIPPGNPFNGTNGRREIWSYGWRNPWRFSFDRETGDLIVGDVGQNRFEEIDFEPAGSPGGLDYGWNRKEGFACFSPSAGCSSAGLVDPVLVYGRSDGCAVTGGYVYRGSRIPALQGRYIYGDYCQGTIWAAGPEDDWTSVVLFDTVFNISTFGEDRDGEIYVADLVNGTVWRIDPPPARRRAVRRRNP